MDPDARGFELRELLGGWRARLKPEDVGLPATTRRRVAGLRRDEVAELVGVSPNWYALFENGGADRRFSAAFVQRVADALRLDEPERALLFRLALPEIRLAVEHFERIARDGVICDLRSIRSLVQRVDAASSFAEASEVAVEAVWELLGPTSVAAAILRPNEGERRIIAAGPRAHVDLANSGIVETCIVANYPNRYGHTTFSEERLAYRETLKGSFSFQQRTVESTGFFVTIAKTAPLAEEALSSALFTDTRAEGFFTDAELSAEEYWDWNSELEACSAITHGLFSEGRYCGNLCALWAEPRGMAARDAEILRTASAIVELAAAPVARPSHQAM